MVSPSAPQSFPPSVLYPAWLLAIYLIYSQGIPALHYEWGVKMQTQDAVETVTQVGTSFWYGFCVADLLVYIPALLLALLNRNQPWASTVLAAALGVTLYWPLVAMVAVVKAQSAPGWDKHDIGEYSLSCRFSCYGPRGVCTNWAALEVTSPFRRRKRSLFT